MMAHGYQAFARGKLSATYHRGGGSADVAHLVLLSLYMVCLVSAYLAYPQIAAALFAHRWHA